MNHPRPFNMLETPDQPINPPDVGDAIEWPEYELTEAKEKALRELYKDGRDLLASGD